MKRSCKAFPARLVAVAVYGLLAATAHAEGTVQQLAGTISVQKPDGSIRVLSRNSAVVQGDTLNTERDSYAQVKFTDGAVVTLKPNTRLRIEEYAFNQADPARDNSAFALVKGGLRMITGLISKRGNQDALRLTTVTATVGIRGTTFTVDDCITTACARRGAVRLSAIPGATDFAALETGTQSDPGWADPPGAPTPAAGESAGGASISARDPFDNLGRQLAQAQPEGSDASLPPAVYVGVSDGEIIVTNSAGAENFRAGQFGAAANFSARPSILPGDPGLPVYQPPATFFQAISGGGVRNANAQCIAN